MGRHRELPIKRRHCADHMISVDSSNLESKHALTLIVGDLESWVHKGREIPDIDGYQFIDISNLTPTFLKELAPNIILSSLVGANFDAIEIARKLGRIDFSGAYRILTHNVPDVGLVLAEVRSAAPRLDVDIIDLANIFPEH